MREVLVKADRAYTEGKLELAVNLYEFVLCRNPSHDYALYMMGSCLVQLGRSGVGMALLQRSIEENPERPEAFHNLGIGLRAEGHTEAAVKLYEMALEKKTSVQSIGNLAGCYVNNGTPEKCIEWCDKGLAINSKDVSLLYHKALALLEMGQLEEGFRLYDNRKYIKEWNPRVYKHPYWGGESVDWLLIHGEQGVGDEILFMSWLRNIRHRAKNIAIECTPRLVKLFERSFGAPCYATDQEADTAHPYDAMVAMGSLPNFGGPIPPHGQYLAPNPERVNDYREKLSELGSGPYIGFSWFGGTKRTHNYVRNARLENWTNLTRYGTGISIQYGKLGVEASQLGLPHWQDAVDDLDEFAALIKALDLVVCVNSTPVHFCGALDVPCWTLTPAQSAWRYGLKAEAMPWYSSVRQFRQEGADWTTAFERVERELVSFTRGPEHQKQIDLLAA